MQPLIFISVCLKGSVISLGETCSGNQNFFFFVDIVFGQKFTRNAKNYLDILFLNFCNFLTLSLWGYWSRVERRARKAVISNLVISLLPYKKGSRLFLKVLFYNNGLNFCQFNWESEWYLSQMPDLKIQFEIDSNMRALVLTWLSALALIGSFFPLIPSFF